MEPFVNDHLTNMIKVRDFVFDMVRQTPLQIVGASEDLAASAPPTFTSLI